MADVRRGRWIVRKVFKRGPYWYLNVRDERTGKIHRVSTRKTRKKWAEEYVEAWIDEQEAREKLVTRSRVPKFEVAFTDWLAAKSVRDVTRADYQHDLDGAYKPHFGQQLVSEITFADAQKFLTKYRDHSTRTRQKHTIALRSFFRWAQRMRYCDQNPFEGIRTSRVRPKRDHVLTENQARELLAACHEEFTLEKKDRRRPRGWTETRSPARDLYVAVALGLYTGLRKTNLFSITSEELDLRQGRIDIPGEHMKAGADHSIPLHPALKTLLRGGSMPLVVSPKSLERAAKRAGIPHVTWRSLRRTFASWLQSRCSYACLKSLMAHALDEDVTGKYLVVSWPEKVRAIAALPDLLASAPVLQAGKVEDSRLSS